VLLCAVLGAGGCKRHPVSAMDGTAAPSLRIYAISTLAGALEPCGCVKNMLGGVDHAAALIGGSRDSLVVGAGPLFFSNPELEPERRAQDVWKAEAIATALGDMRLAAWAPGANDWAAGAPELARLAKLSGASPLAANIEGAEAVRVVTINGHQVGIAGVSMPHHAGELPSGAKVDDPRAALERAKRMLDDKQVQIRVALVALARGEALRLAEAVPDFQLFVIGKPRDQGEANDGVTPPVLVGDTLVVQAPNHLQRVAVIDLFVRDGSHRFQDGSRVRESERRASLERRVSELSERITQWEKQGGAVERTDLEARRSDLERLRRELAELEAPTEVGEGSFFRYRLVDVVEQLGTDPAVAARLAAYYRRVNEHNRIAFAHHAPPPAAEGQSSYVGTEQCSGCHAEAQAFWDKTRHAKAYATLEKEHKQFNLDCVGCHVTGYEKPGGSTVTHVEGLKSVQCETCHGPGSRHLKEPANPALIETTPPRSLCAASCHHPPHVNESWNVDQAWKRIVGPGHGG
jgi:2',3'-cyclic-nucleotide 2'-phosphodiesterase (5'-nucleotidase family)